MNLYKYGTMCVPFDASSLEDTMVMVQDQLDISSARGWRLHSVHHVGDQVILYFERTLEGAEAVAFLEGETKRGQAVLDAIKKQQPSA